MDAAAQDGDRVTVDFEGRHRWRALPGRQGRRLPLLVGEGQMLKEFEDAVRGMKPGESRPSAGLPRGIPRAGRGRQDGGLLVTVKKIEAAHLPEVNDALAKSLALPMALPGGLRRHPDPTLEREVKFRLLAQQAGRDGRPGVQGRTGSAQRQRAGEIDRLKEGARADLEAARHQNADKAEILDDIFRAQAERRVRLGLVVAELVANSLHAKPEQPRPISMSWPPATRSPKTWCALVFQRPPAPGRGGGRGH